jgi:hypothetical protein
MKETILKGTGCQDKRIELLTTLLTKALEKTNHIDEIRGRNMNYALLIFAGLYGAGIALEHVVYHFSISTAIVFIMLIFTFWDHRLHKINHGWRRTSSMYCKKITKIINDPEKDVSFCQFIFEKKERVEWFGFQPIIFYLLVIGGVSSYFIFSYFPR